jgi:predicted signal transduction protein with EAL and GGDEF domain
MGGDEFVIVVPDVTIEVLTELGERLIHAIHEPMEFEGIEVLPSASIGVSLHQGGGDADSLIRDADIAMYTAKANGRNGLSVFVASRHSEMTRREVAERFRDAIHDYQIELVYQPIVSLATHHVAGVEALARWTDTELGAISPQQFVELAHNLGALPLLTERIIERAFQDHSMWKHHLGEACPWISINLSLGQLADRSFAETVERYLVEYRVDPSMLVFEVAEDAAMGELSATLRQLGAIRRLGCKVAIDDFGSGYSNLLHLRQLPLSQLKLAPEMIAHLEDETDVHLLKAVRALGVAMGFEVIAKGIELPGQESALQMLEFQFGQGWLFGRAASADHILRLIEMTREPVMSTN